MIVLNKLKHPDFLRALSAPPGSNCPDRLVNIFSVIFLYKLSSPPTPCVIHKNIFISSLKHDVDIYRDLPTDVMRSVGSTVYPVAADRMQKEIMFLALSTMKIKIINGMSAGTLDCRSHPGFLLHLPAGVGQQAGVQQLWTRA